MHVSDELVDKLATLAKLEFQGDEKEAIKADFQRMLDFVEKLNDLNTDNVAPLIHMSDAKNAFRTDELSKEKYHKKALKNAPESDSDYFKVPKVLR